MSKAKCELKPNGFFDWCDGMEHMMEPEANVASFRKGIVQVNVTKMSELKTWCIGAAMMRFKEKLMFNKCPWCGEEINNRECKGTGEPI